LKKLLACATLEAGELDFRWNEWNVEHLAKHGVEPEAAEQAVEAAGRRFPRRVGEDKWPTWGTDERGRLLTETEKRRHRRRSR
jgi:hypothetical protein